jgi:hypothetical protein
VHFDSQHLEPGSAVIPLGIRSLGEKEGGGGKKGARINGYLKFDPRVIATSASAFEAYPVRNLTAGAGRSDRTEPTVEKVRWRNREAVLVSYTLKIGTTVRTTYVPDMAYCIVKCESFGVFKDGKKRVQTMEAEPGAHGPQSVWFPDRVSIEHTVDDLKVYTAHLEITEANFWDSVSPSVFTLAGMEIPRDTEIDLRPDAPGTHYWDGERIVRELTRKIDADAPSPSQAGNAGRWWMGASAALAAAAIAVFIWYLFHAHKVRK